MFRHDLMMSMLDIHPVNITMIPKIIVGNRISLCDDSVLPRNNPAVRFVSLIEVIVLTNGTVVMIGLYSTSADSWKYRNPGASV